MRSDTPPNVSGEVSQGHEAVPSDARRPDGGGLRSAFAGLVSVRVPSPRSVFATAGSLLVLLVVCGVLVTVFDAFLEGRLVGSAPAGRSLFGVVGLVAGASSLALLLPVALDGPTGPRPLVERRPGRLVFGLGLLVLSAVCALLWGRGLVAA